MLAREPNPVRDYVFAVGDETCTGSGEAARERRPLFLAGIACAAASLATSDFDPERGLPLRLGFTSDFLSASAEADTVVVAARATFAAGLRPSPSSFARVDRLSE